MKPVLIYVRPLDQTTGQRVEVRIGDGLSAEDYGTGGVPWQPAMITRPTLSIELMSTDMDGTVQAGKASFEINLRSLRGIDAPELLYWKGAQVIIRSNGVLEGPSAVPDFWGYITGGSPDRDTGRLKLNAEVSTAFLDQNMLTLEFTGGGGALGDPTKRGVLKPAGFGAQGNIEPVWFDLTRYIGQIDGYGNTLAINWLGEGLSSFGPPVADYPTYAALAAGIDNHQVPPGRWGTCIAEGMVGLGAPPVGVITCHATFGANRIGAMMKRLLLTHAKVPAERVDTAAFDQLDALVPRPVHYWTADQVNVKERCEALAASCNATPLVTFQNKVTVTRATVSAPVATLDRSGSVAPRVKGWATADVDPPFAQLKARAARPALVMSFDQVNYSDTIVDRGLYYTDTVYRQGNVVYLSNGSKWLFISPIASSGHNPPLPPETSDNYWQQLLPPTTAENITYADGTPIEDLKPSQPGADVTGDNTSKDTLSVSGRAGVDVITGIDTNTMAVLEQALRQEDLAAITDARTFVEGQPVSTYFLNFRNEQIGNVANLGAMIAGVSNAFGPVNTALNAQVQINAAADLKFNTQAETNVRTNSKFVVVNSTFSLLGAKTEDGTGWVLSLDTVQIGNGKTLAQKFDQIGVDNGIVAGSVSTLAETVVALDGRVNSQYTLAVTAGGRVAGFTVGNTGIVRSITFLTDNFTIASDDNGVAFSPFSISNGVVYMREVVVSKLTIGAVDTTNLTSNSIRNFYSTELASNFTVPTNNGQKARLLTLTVSKQFADSAIRIEALMRPRPARDYACMFQFGRNSGGDDIVMDTLQFWAASAEIDNVRSLRIPVSFGRSFFGIPVGSHTFFVDIIAVGGGNAQSFVEAGSNLDIEERKR